MKIWRKELKARVLHENVTVMTATAPATVEIKIANTIKFITRT